MNKVGIIGYGNLGKFLAKNIIADTNLELAFVYNRETARIGNEIPADKILTKLENFNTKDVDLIVEVAHPDISEQYAVSFLQHTNYMIGSPTAMANQNLQKKIYSCLENDAKGKLYIPRGAMWYLERILLMSKEDTLAEIKITMKKHPLSIHYHGPLETPLAKISKETILYEGSARKLCEYAPNNVNTIAVAALAAHKQGLDNTQAILIADPALDAHIIEVELYGHGEPGKRYFEKSYRHNPALQGAVTGSATYHSFFSSIKKACLLGVSDNMIEFC